MSFLKPRMNRLPRWEGPVLERKSNPGFPRCPQPELEGRTCYVEGGTVLLLLSVKILLQTSALLQATWLLPEAYGGRSHKPPPLGISRKGCPHAGAERACRRVHTSSLNLFILLWCRRGTSWSSGCTTDDWGTRTQTRGEHTGFPALGVKTASYLPLLLPTTLAPAGKERERCDPRQSSVSISESRGQQAKGCNKSWQFCAGNLDHSLDEALSWGPELHHQPTRKAPACIFEKQKAACLLPDLVRTVWDKWNQLSKNQFSIMNMFIWKIILYTHLVIFLIKYIFHLKLNTWNKTTGDTKNGSVSLIVKNVTNIHVPKTSRCQAAENESTSETCGYLIRFHFKGMASMEPSH